MNQPVLREAAVTKYAFEVVYFSKDSLDGNNKCTFQFPSVWNGLPTKKKAIGFRYAKCNPSSYYIAFDVIIQGTLENGDSFDESWVPILPVSILVTESNTLNEVVYEIEKQLNEGYNAWYSTAVDIQKRYFDEYFVINAPIYRNDDGSYKIEFAIHSIIRSDVLGYSINLYVHNESVVQDHEDFSGCDYYRFFTNLYRFFNQDIPEERYEMEFGGFDNCWDHKNLYIHSDIVTNTNYQLLDRIDTFYRKPSKIYEHNNSGNVFHVWFSFDGKHRRELKYDEIEVALCFMADVRDSYALT